MDGLKTIMLASDVIALIRNRRSIREFVERPVAKELIDVIVECGLAAPSSKNSNPWFIVTASGDDKNRIVNWLEEASNTAVGVTERAPIDPLTGETKKGVTDTVAESISTMRQCDTLLLLFNRGPFSRGAATIATLIENGGKSSVIGKALYGYAGEIIGIGAAAENMLLAARALGLGGVYIADSYPARQKITAGLKTSRELVGMIALGYPAYDPPPRELRSALTAAWKDAIGTIDGNLLEQD
jgi:nitroreductase